MTGSEHRTRGSSTGALMSPLSMMMATTMTKMSQRTPSCVSSLTTCSSLTLWS